MHKRTQAVAISEEVKMKVWERDKHRCIYCMRQIPWQFSCSHFIKRSQGGLGIEENIVTACPECHRRYDSSWEHRKMYEYTEKYLRKFYPDLDVNKLKYNKWEGFKYE